MKTAVLALATVVCACALAADAYAHLTCYYVDASPKPMRICEEGIGAGNTFDLMIDCLGPDGCGPCGICHAGASPRATKGFSPQPHVMSFSYDLKRGEKIPLGERGFAHLTSINGRKCVVKGDKPIHCFPSNAVVVKDRRGKPVGVVTPR